MANGYMPGHNSFSTGFGRFDPVPPVTERARNEPGREGQARASETRLRGLLLQGMAGDASAYHAFLKELAAHLRAFLRKRLAQRPDDVEDIVQETILAVHNQRHTYDPGLPLTAWAHAIARYKMVDWLRRRAESHLRGSFGFTSDDLVKFGIQPRKTGPRGPRKPQPPVVTPPPAVK